MISIEEQIQIIDRTIIRINGFKVGLCSLINMQLPTNIATTLEINRYIPLFTRDNAIEVANSRSDTFVYWWSIGPYDYDNRLYFLGWIKNELIKQLK